VTRAALAGTSAFALAYLLAGTLQLPVLIYDPVARVASFSRSASGISVRYFGDLLLATAAGLVATGVSRRLRPRAPLAVAAGTTMSLVALDVVYYLSRLLAAS
jgi:hypothetical protein